MIHNQPVYVQMLEYDNISKIVIAIDISYKWKEWQEERKR